METIFLIKHKGDFFQPEKNDDMKKSLILTQSSKIMATYVQVKSI